MNRILKAYNGTLGLLITAIVAGIIGAAIANSLFGSVTRNIGPIEVRVSASPSMNGRTLVEFPPLGTMEADTHKAPVVLTAAVQEAKPEELRSIIANQTGARQLVKDLHSDAEKTAVALIVKLLLAAVLGGGLLAFVVCHRRRWAASLVGAASGTAITTVLLLAVFLPYNTAAFTDPTLHGPIESAPWVVKLVRDRFEKLDDVDMQLKVAANNVLKLESQLGAVNPGADPDSDTRILAISDLHNNLIAMNYLGTLAKRADVDFIVNAGDLTDFGSPFEEAFAEQIRRMGRRQVFVAGNHDSPKTITALKHIRGVLLPDERAVQVSGIRILGQNDPASRINKPERPLVATPGQLAASASRLEQILARQRRKPDIVLVHTPAVAKHFIGKVPVVICGHVHKMTVEKRGGSVWVNPGSSGAEGIRYLQGNDPKPVTAVILHVKRRPKVIVTAADLISVNSMTGEFTIQRKRF